MKIMLIAVVYEYGGVSSVIRNVMDAFNEGKSRIVFVVEKLASEHYPLNKGIKFINLDIKPAKAASGKICNIFRHLQQIRKTIICEDPDVVLSFGLSINCLLLASLLWARKGLPRIVLTEHSEDLFVKQNKLGIKQNLLRILYKISMSLLYHKADYIVTVSDNISKCIRKLPFMPSRKVRVIYNPIDISRVNRLRIEGEVLDESGGAIPCIGTASRLSAEKGVNFLLEGFLKVLKKIDARLIIVGDGAEKTTLEKMADYLEIRDRIIFTGWVQNPFKYLAKMDIFVLPSLWEGFPNVVLEAMACGVPVIATDSSGGIREVIQNGVNGVLIEPGSSSAVSDAVYSLLIDKAKRQDIIKKAYMTVDKFDISRIKKQYENLMFN
ncbi:glycosyltransferase family 4 protein [Candidatus Omnitrophota bacterium]